MPPFVYQNYRNPYITSISDLIQAPGSIEAQRAQAVGQAQAQAAARSGAAWSGVAQNIGQDLSGAIQSYQTMRQNAPLREAQLADIKSQGAERDSITAERNQRTQALQQLQADQPEIARILSTGGDRQSIIDSVRGTPDERLIPQIEQSFDAAAKRKADFEKTVAETAASNASAEEKRQIVADKHADYLGGVAADVAKHEYDPVAFFHAVALAHKDQMIDDVTAGKAIALGIQTPDQIKPFVDARIAASPEQRKLAEAAAAKAAVPPKQYQVTVPGPDGKPVTKLVDEAAMQAGVQTYQRPPAAPADTNSTSDVVETIKGMQDGTLPPIMPGRATKEYTQLLAEAHRQGYDLASAATDWAATQKHISTMNSNQQLRLNQSINALPDLLDSVDALASKWKGGHFPVLNRANIAAAKGGAYGDEVATVARQLDAQIADVTGDLGNVYMGGNSPTDHALALAAKSLSGDWSEKVLHDMVTLAKSNVKIRQNSIRNTGVAGASQDNPYGSQAPVGAPPPAAAPPPATDGWGIKRTPR